MAEMLSHQTIGAEDKGTWSSSKRVCSQQSSIAVVANAQYSDSVEEWATMLCLFTHQTTKVLPRNTQYPIVERQFDVACLIRIKKMQLAEVVQV